MTNYNFIGIGINSYRNLQPLSYAQADIEGLEQFFCEEARIHPDQTLTFTDNSPWVNEEPTYPTKKNLLDWLARGLNNGSPNSTRSGSSILWFAFSGYAVNHLGEDYLLPIDAQLDNPAATGIPVKQVFNALRQQGASKIIALLDMNRSTAVVGNGEVGEQTLDLAGQMGIAAILSCKPDQFSHETAALRHGMFTASVLEALRYHRSNLTLDLLNNYLGDRLKELSEHHWRPVQTPVMVLPSLAASRELIVPSGDSTRIHWQAAVPIGASLVGQANGKDIELPPFTNGHGNSSHINMGINDEGKIPADQPAEVVIDDLEGYPYAEDTDANHDFDAAAINENDLFVGETDIDPTEPAMMPSNFASSPRKKKQPWYLAGWRWLMLLLLLLLGGLAWQLFQGKGFNLNNILQPIGIELPGNDNTTDGNGNNTATSGNNGETNLDGSPANSGNDTTADGSEANGGNPVNGSDANGNNGNATSSGDGTGVNGAAGNDGNAAAPSNASNPDGADGSADNGTENNNGNVAANPGNSSGVNGAATGDGSNATNSGNAGTNNASAGNGNNAANADNDAASGANGVNTATPGNNGAGANAGTGTAANTSGNGSGASGTGSTASNGNGSASSTATGNQAANSAGDDANANNGSGNSQGHATGTNGSTDNAATGTNTAGGTNAAGQTTNPSVLVPNGQEVQAKNAAILLEANQVLRSSQASSFNQAIAATRNIKQGTPLYNEARTQINRWSRVILDIAEARAIKGDLKGAIAAARLVPPDVPQVHGLAQNAIKKWEQQVGKTDINRQIIINAQEEIIPNQASSYNRAISILKTIKPNDPIFAEGQSLQAQWSRTIYLLANSRAAQGNFKLAVETAKLVPADSPSHTSAKGAIARWQQGIR